MNSVWIKFYGLIGLVSSIGKNSFNFGEKFNKFNEDTCYYAEKAFEKLREASESLKGAWQYGAEMNENAKERCQGWETWANEKVEEVKQQEELKENWIQLNKQHGYSPQPSKNSFEKVWEAAATKKQEIWPEKRYTLPNRENTRRPNCLQKVLSLY